ncbi:RNA polymerase-associated protein rtf1 [Linderina macrospora]|uniref:RNA polymerase-associated protein rtf1 n=1 Tax=Linderina macrospora TaxID=4868 RepID=A0ACC1JB69_9FUNG|nr:RNA polymerase-associated protein rtf1 [Linderina macrospora]
MDKLENDILELFEDEGTSGGRNDSRSKTHSSHKRRHHSRDRPSPRKHTRRSDYSGSDSNMDVDSDSNVSIADSRTDHDDEQPVDEWGPDLMGDQKDRKWLSSLNEVERERILAERQEKRDLLEEQRELKLKLKAGSRVADAGKSRRSDRYESSRGAFSDLKRARERRHHGDGGWTPSGDDLESEEEGEPAATLEELQTICLSRNQIEKWLFAPFFAEAAIGCFTRIVIRESDSHGEYNTYKMMEIVDVVQGHGQNQPPYSVNKTLTDKYLVLKYGALERDYSMETISNSPIKVEEYNSWESVLRSDRVRERPTPSDVVRKREALDKAGSYQLTDADITAMVNERNRLAQLVSSGTTMNPALERAKLLRRRLEATQNSNWEMIDEIDKRLEDLAKNGSAKADAAGARTTGGNKVLLAPSTSTRLGATDGAHTPVRRNKLLVPTPKNIGQLTTSGAGAKHGEAGKINGFPLVPQIRVPELSLRSKTTPGFVEMMAKNGGYDLSFLSADQ